MVETTAANPELLQEQVSSLLIQPLEAQSLVLASGPRIFDSASPLRIPKLASSTTPGLVGEGELIPEHDVDFDEVKLMPSDRKSIKTLIRFSNELLRQSTIGLDSVLKQRLVKDVADKLDDEMLLGDGTNGGMTGLLKQPDAQRGVLDPSDPDTLLDALALAAAAEVNPTRWFLSGADFFSIRKLKDASGKYLLEADLTADTTYRLFGVPVTVSNKIPAGQAVLANMGEVAVVRDTNPSVTLDSSRYLEYDEQAIRVTARFDLGLLRPEGVVLLSAES